MMSEMTSVVQRVQMIERHEQGASLMQIASEMQLNFYTVRKWWRRYQRQGWAGLQAKVRQGNQALADFAPLVRYVALRLKCEHPGWGADVLLLAMSRRVSLAGLRLPKRSTLAAYLQPFLVRLHPRRYPGLRRPQPPLVKATVQVHQRWQMDFKGDTPLAALGLVQAWNLCDEHSGVPLASVIYAARQGKPNRAVTFRTIQANLRQAFGQWGLPQQLRMDRDATWLGSSRLEWPGTLLLWLVGLGVQPVVNRPFRPTDNAVVERLNRTWYEHVALGSKAQTVAQLQAETEQAWRDRRSALPSYNRHCRHQIPLVRFPHLQEPRRPFDRASEAQLFAIERVHTYLAAWRWLRKVDVTGCISLLNRNHLLGRHFAGQTVRVCFDLASADLAISQLDDQLIRHIHLPALTAEYILGSDTS
jgi:hypothetical protein